MKRLLCFSLCLGLMVSACKKKSALENLNKAISKDKAGGGSGGGDGGDGGGGTVTKKNKAAVIKACLSLINTHMQRAENPRQDAFFLRSSTVWNTTAADPLVVFYVGQGMPLQLTEHGFGQTAAAVTKNLNAMAASKVIQNQFAARDNNASGWRVHISYANTDVEIPASANGAAPDAPADDSGIIIYDRENVQVDGAQSPRIPARDSLDAANHLFLRGGWFDCVVNDKTQDVTLKYAAAPLT